MRRHLWMVPVAAAVVLTAYLLGKPAPAPADPSESTPASSVQVKEGPGAVATPLIVDEKFNSPPLPPATSPASPALPISQIVLYSSGVGYFQRDGQVDGNARVDLTFPTQDINDLLKSMVLQDLGGGHVSAVSFDSQDPVNKTLNSFAINLANNPSYSDILNQARGEKVEVSLLKTGQQYDSLQKYELVNVIGTIVSVEAKPANKDMSAVEMLNVWSAGAMRSVSLAEVQQIKFLNPAVESEVQRALTVLASAHDTDKKAVTLHFNGTGKRAVRIGYVVETPLWRTSYRLLVGKDGKLFMQGWAVVQNPTNEDWKDVRMALVSGRPISFQMDLYRPLYVPRPVVQPELYASIRPTTHNGDLGVAIANDYSIHGADLEKANAYGGLASIAVGRPASTSGLPVGTNLPTPEQPYQFYFGISNDGPASQINLNRGIVAASKATDLGDSFQYAIEHPVTIARQKSALLPIVSKDLEGDKVSLYSPQSHPKYPLLALRLKNTTGVHLMQGPVAVFEGPNYCGDAQLPNLQPKEERLVSYALDLGTEVEAVPAQAPQRLASIRLHKGVLTTTSKQRLATSYTIKNRSPHDRVILVEHADQPGCKLVSKDEPKERARGVYRFEKKLVAGKTVKFEVALEQDVRQETALLGCTVDTIRYLLQYDFSDAQAKTALEKVLALQEQLTAMRKQRTAIQEELTNIMRDQERLRANLKEMPASANAYKRYLEKFDKQETTIETLQKQIQDLTARDERQVRECEVYLNGLNLEATIQKTAAQR